MISLGAFATAGLEAVHAPMPYVPYKGIPAIYQPIAADPEPFAVLELADLRWFVYTQQRSLYAGSNVALESR